MALQRDGRTIYVPAADSHLRNTIRPGSGIVGTAVPDTGRILIDYEGAIYGQDMAYDDKIRHAWGRHTWEERGYPTVARALVEAEQLIEVGFLTIADPTDDDVANEIKAQIGDPYDGLPTSDLLRGLPPSAVEHVRRQLAQPQVHIDRQDVVDEWCAT